MSVKVLITRTIPGDKGRDMLQLFRDMRNLATAQPGYISGETLKSNDRPDVFLVISTWESAAVNRPSTKHSRSCHTARGTTFHRRRSPESASCCQPGRNGRWN